MTEEERRADFERRLMESGEEATKRVIARMDALQKLTPEERRALGRR